MDKWPKQVKKNPRFGDAYMDEWAQNWFWDGELWVSSDAGYITDARFQKVVRNVKEHMAKREKIMKLSAWQLRIRRMQQDAEDPEEKKMTADAFKRRTRPVEELDAEDPPKYIRLKGQLFKRVEG